MRIRLGAWDGATEDGGRRAAAWRSGMGGGWWPAAQWIEVEPALDEAVPECRRLVRAGVGSAAPPVGLSLSVSVGSSVLVFGIECDETRD